MSEERPGRERKGGAYRLLGSGAGYDLWQRLLGGDAARARLVRDFMRPAPNARILELGCGTAEYLSHLPADVAYVGLDASPRYIAAAEQRFGGQARFVCARAEAAAGDLLDEPFDLVLAMGILHHLPDEEALGLVDLGHRALRPGGVLLTLDATLHDGQGLASRLLVGLDRGTHVRPPEPYRALLASRFRDIETHLVRDLLAFPYSHFIMRATRSW